MRSPNVGIRAQNVWLPEPIQRRFFCTQRPAPTGRRYRGVGGYAAAVNCSKKISGRFLTSLCSGEDLAAIPRSAVSYPEVLNVS